MYQFGIFIFSEKEIVQISCLMKSWVEGYIQPIKRTTLSKQVIRYALYWKLLEDRNGKLYFPQSSNFDAVYDLPVEALWRMVAPMLRVEGATGYSIVNNKGWGLLNIYPQNSRFASDRDLEAKENILIKLSNHHYIHLQMAGTVWNIYPEKDVPVSQIS